MDTRREIISIAISGLVFLSTSATGSWAARSHVSSPVRGAPEACALLTNADASKALEVSSVSSKRLVEADPKGCVWSNDPAVSDTSRRVALVTHTPTAFMFAKKPAITTIKIEAVAGLGDEAFYQIYPGDNPPLIWVRKGITAISIRIITGAKPNPFTPEQEKTKLAALAKAAVGKL